MPAEKPWVLTEEEDAEAEDAFLERQSADRSLQLAIAAHTAAIKKLDKRLMVFWDSMYEKFDLDPEGDYRTKRLPSGTEIVFTGDA